MKLTTKARYAVMAMVDLAANNDGSPITLADIAARQEISLAYLEQLFCKLRRAGLVSSVRGPGGGYILAHPAGETWIADIVLAVDEPIRATRCSPNSPGGCLSAGQSCLTHDLWAELGDQIYRFLASVSLEDVVSGRLPHSADSAVLTPRSVGAGAAPTPAEGSIEACAAAQK